MKKVLISMMVAVMASVSAFAVENWVSIDFANSARDTNPSVENVKYYTAYLCTKDAAKEMFGVDTYTEVANYLKNNYETGWAKIEEGGTQIGTKKENQKWGLGQYTFTQFFEAMPASDEYLALINYKTDSADGTPEINVMSGSYSGTGGFAFDDAVNPSSSWTQTVPEPTSGMLFLLGSALLALKRKRS